MEQELFQESKKVGNNEAYIIESTGQIKIQKELFIKYETEFENLKVEVKKVLEKPLSKNDKKNLKEFFLNLK